MRPETSEASAREQRIGGSMRPETSEASAREQRIGGSMLRRDFLWILGGSLVACSANETVDRPAPEGTPDAEPLADATPPDACAQAVVTMHDTYAQALYLDNSLGPLTGVIEVAFVVAGAAITIDFWHGHGGQPHRYTLTPEHFAALVRGERITLGTTTVDNHAHTLFVDPRDEAYRVPGAPDIDVPLGHCEE
jgi:hypothetical protein